MPESERAERTWETEALMQVQGVGSFIRVLLPVRLTGGHQLTFGLWLCVSDEDLQRAFHEWWAPTYHDLVLDGTIANEVPPWGLFTRPARAVVRDPNKVPYLDSSEDPELSGVLREEWPHEAVIDALPAHLG